MGPERVPTGIEGLDRLIGGGLVRGTWTLAYGPPGTGKTVFGMQFTWEGIKRGEVVSYDSVDRPFEPEGILRLLWLEGRSTGVSGALCPGSVVPALRELSERAAYHLS